ncbi:conserved hypothetical protein [Pseudomonas veronii]|uniref:hypothetical protein n=1 Tax=Pseudomonas TaxID=286 RepID=UPI001769EAB8|nr:MULTISPECIES: hypothetical protein [Pseudomonas]WLH26019.1 hypothetical protein PSH76_09380 [Pseudomonas sp. FP215]CAD0264314.1 conserved hypothetical protein [Pseudomonas veronii]
MHEHIELESLASELEDDLVDRYGLMLGSTALWRELGYTSHEAFRKAKQRGRIEVPLFDVPNRRGSFALSKEVATWIARQRCAALLQLPEGMQKEAR